MKPFLKRWRTTLGDGLLLLPLVFLLLQGFKGMFAILEELSFRGRPNRGWWLRLALQVVVMAALWCVSAAALVLPARRLDSSKPRLQWFVPVLLPLIAAIVVDLCWLGVDRHSGLGYGSLLALWGLPVAWLRSWCVSRASDKGPR